MTSLKTEYWCDQPAQANRVYNALRLAHAHALTKSDKMWLAMIDVEAVYSQLVRFEVTSMIVNNAYLVAYEVGAAWWNPKRSMLAEKLVLDLGNHNENFDLIPQFLDYAAVQHGVKLIAVGTAFAHSDRALSRKYESYGYQPVGHELMKEL